jgi:branched-chain amino acid transport system permease protein
VRRSLLIRGNLGRAAAGVAVVAAVAAVPSTLLGGDQYEIGVATLVVIFAIWASGWNLISGYAGQFSFGHAVFCGLGAYVSASLFASHGTSPWLGGLIGGLVGAAGGVLIGLPAFRLRGPYFALTTIAFSEIVRLVVSSTDRIGSFDVGGPQGINLPISSETSFAKLQFVDASAYYYLALAFLAVVLALTAWLARSKIGYYWGAIRTDPDAAASLGVPVLRYKLLAVALSGFVCGVGGALYAQYVGFIEPNRILGLDLSIQIALFGLVGGRATVFGPAVGAAILYPIGEVLRAELGATSGAPTLLFGVVLILAIYFLPNGVVGLRWRRKRRRPGLPEPEAGAAAPELTHAS